MNEGVHEHPVSIVIRDDLGRSRLTVFFRLLLAIPHYIWWLLWTIGVVFAAVAGWLVALITGTLPGGLHRFFCAYINYTEHLFGYLLLVTDPYPEFVGAPSERNPLDIVLPAEPLAQSRWRILLRLVLALPALVVALALGGVGGGSARGNTRGGSTSTGFTSSGLSAITSLLGWFACVARGRMPKGFRDAGGYVCGYWAQILAYLLLVTDRYPYADPTSMLAGIERPPVHPVHVVGDADDLRMSRVTVLFRLPLVIPHLFWLALWGVVVFLVSIVQWLITLIRGRPISALHGFIARWVRYGFHVYAFFALVANPFPGFTGRLGQYPLDLVTPPVERQNRWKTLFRGVLAFPALLVAGALGVALFTDAFLTWFVALFTSRAPEGLRNLSAYALRYSGQTYAYLFFVTDSYPHSSPLEGADPVPAEAAAEVGEAEAA
jgi:hypothetical protein